MVTVTEHDVQRRLEQIKQRLQEYEDQIAGLKEAEANLEITLATMRQLSGSETSFAPKVAGEGRKPSGAPTVPEMIIKILSEHSDGAEPKKVIEIIRREWWPEAPGGSIGPILWRMAKEGRLAKRGSRYFTSSETPRDGQAVTA